MPEKLTLAVYLERRGVVKALTRIEAEVFGVQYPLVKGWAHRHGTDEITQAMLDQLQEKIGRARSSTAEKARRGLNGVEGVKPTQATKRRLGSKASQALAEPIQKLSPICGFVLRRANRYRVRSHT
ncbi:hypothetical protein [Massilia haematophila]|uniref:Transcriptional regulator n=1 Tax=Massilia haematophila TaxID=457923 RepID=A0ABV7PFD0_9BURK